MTIRVVYDTGRDEFKVTGFLPYARKIRYTVADLNQAGVLNVPVQARTFVVGVALHINVPFDGAAPDVTVGDGVNPTGFFAQGDIDPTTPDELKHSIGLAPNAFASGRYFPQAGVIAVSHNADAAQGAATLYVIELRAEENWRSIGDIGQNG